MISSQNKLSHIQMELLNSLKFISNESELRDVKQLLNLYYRYKLDTAIDEAEQSRNLSVEVYQAWLNGEKA